MAASSALVEPSDSARDVPEHPNNSALEFDEDVDPNDELGSLYAMYKSVVAPKPGAIVQLPDTKLYSMIIHACDNILRMHSKKLETKDEKKEEKDGEEVDPLDLLPEVLPAQFHNIYARALLSMGKILQDEEEDEEDEDDEEDDNASSSKNTAKSEKEDTTATAKSLHDTPADFIDAALERAVTGFETFPQSQALLFTQSRAHVAKVAESLKRDTLEVFESLTDRLFAPIDTALEKFESAEAKAGEKDEATTAPYSDFELGTIETLLEIGDHIGASLPLALSLLEGADDEGKKKKKSKKAKKDASNLKREDLETLAAIEDKYLTWSKQRYEKVLESLPVETSAVATDKKGKGKKSANGTEPSSVPVELQELANQANKGLGKYYSAKAAPLLEEYEAILEDLPEEDEEEQETDAEVAARLATVKSEAQALMEKAVAHFLAAEPTDATESDNDVENAVRGERFALAAEAQISLANLLLDEADEKEQEKLYKEAVKRLRLAQRLGAGDFSEQIRDLLP